MLRGDSNKAIAFQLGLTAGTVKIYLHTIYARFGVKSRAELIVKLTGDEHEREEARRQDDCTRCVYKRSYYLSAERALTGEGTEEQLQLSLPF